MQVCSLDISSLPPTLPVSIARAVPGASLAYEHCRPLETEITSTKPHLLAKARFLGYLLREAPTERGRRALCQAISGCDQKFDRLIELAEFWTDHVLRACMSSVDASCVILLLI